MKVEKNGISHFIKAPITYILKPNLCFLIRCPRLTELFQTLVLLENENVTSIVERMQDYQVIAMVILLGPKLKRIQNQIQEEVKKMMSGQLHVPSIRGKTKAINGDGYTKPPLIASCNSFGSKGIGVVVRIAATTTESVYSFLHSQLTGMESMLGLCPYL